VSPLTDVGFDPFGFTNYIDLKFLREAEIKHCRITMLAVLGLFVQEFYTLPFYSGPALAEPSHNFYVAHGAMKQLLLWTSGLEIITGVPALLQMMQGSPRRPGEFGFDPLGLAKNNAAFARWQNAELINGRLAMIAVGGLIHQVRCAAPACVLCGSEGLSGRSRDFLPPVHDSNPPLSFHCFSVALSCVACPTTGVDDEADAHPPAHGRQDFPVKGLAAASVKMPSLAGCLVCFLCAASRGPFGLLDVV